MQRIKQTKSVKSLKSLNSLLSMEVILTTLVIACFVAIMASCSTLSPTAKDFTAATKASYHNADSQLDYESGKNQENFKADVSLDPASGKVTGFHIETTATTPEAAIAETGKALAAAAAALNNIISQIPLIAKQAAMAGS